jgi:3-oxoacid CoA-transferase B subunit
MVKGMGGAMDLVSGAKKVIITMEHMNRAEPKILRKCTLPLTGLSCVDMCITEKAVFKWDKQTREMVLCEVAKGMSLDHIEETTPCAYTVSPDLKEF